MTEFQDSSTHNIIKVPDEPLFFPPILHNLLFFPTKIIIDFIHNSFHTRFFIWFSSLLTQVSEKSCTFKNIFFSNEVIFAEKQYHR